MKENYISPQIDVILMDCCMAPICVSNMGSAGASGEDYSIVQGAFDSDSDVL